MRFLHMAVNYMYFEGSKILPEKAADIIVMFYLLVFLISQLKVFFICVSPCELFYFLYPKEIVSLYFDFS